MTYSLTKSAALAVPLTLAALPALADGHAGTAGYALANDGATLVVMASIAAPDQIETFDLATPLHGLAYRPVTGELYGFTDGMIVTINPMTGEQTDLGASFADDAMTAGDAVAFDFNNAIDAVRAVGSDGANLVYFPEGFGDNNDRANSVLRFTDTFYTDGDMNADFTPEIFANAYTNAIAGQTAAGTAQYALDATTNSLVALANNAGELTSVAFLELDGSTIDLSPMGGFDIISPEEGTDAAYAILQMDGADTAGLYAVNLQTAELTMLADLGMGGFTGFAVAPAM